jgi:D-glycerate 3-kinase
VVINSSLHAALELFIAKEKLPSTYLETVEQWFLPLAEQILHKVSRSNQALLVGVSGCQGSGKSTLAALLVMLLKELMGLNCINLSIDDFYLTYTERQTLARTVHPLLATRGVPGTHDIELAISTINKLRASGHVNIPRFNKAIDDRLPAADWPRKQAPVDVIVLEGWCLAVPAQSEQDLLPALNVLEQQEDPSGIWRNHVNEQIRTVYTPFYNMIDYLIMLKAPDFAKVFEWRQNQENKLAALQVAGQNNRVMNKEQLIRFIHHYERVTRHGLKILPQRANVVFELTDAQTIAGRLIG